MIKGPRILFLDIETAPMLGYVWSLWDNNVALNQLAKDWHILSWSAKWAHSSEIMYKDQRAELDITNDKSLMKQLQALLQKADIIVTHNGKQFDQKKINARFVYHRLKPIGGYRHIDTCEIAKRKFGFTSNKLEYLSSFLQIENKKYTKRKFPGFELWSECLKGNTKAWSEMEKYNKIDVLALEEVYHRLAAWDESINFNVYTDSLTNVCKCGCKKFHKAGHRFTQSGKYQRYSCVDCGAYQTSRENLLSKEKRQALKKGA